MRDDPSIKGGELSYLQLRPLDPSRPPVRLAPNDEVGGFLLEPGGKSILIAVGGPTGASIWTAPFQPVKKP